MRKNEFTGTYRVCGLELLRKKFKVNVVSQGIGDSDSEIAERWNCSIGIHKCARGVYNGGSAPATSSAATHTRWVKQVVLLYLVAGWVLWIGPQCPPGSARIRCLLRFLDVSLQHCKFVLFRENCTASVSRFSLCSSNRFRRNLNILSVYTFDECIFHSGLTNKLEILVGSPKKKVAKGAISNGQYAF